MNVKCEHCGHEGPKGSFQYQYNVRLDKDACWRKCPICGAWTLYEEKTGKILNYEELVKNW